MNAQVVLGYEISIAEKNWISRGEWTGLVSSQNESPIEFEVALPEFGIENEEIDIVFQGKGFSPMLALKVIRVQE